MGTPAKPAELLYRGAELGGLRLTLPDCFLRQAPDILGKPFGGFAAI